MIKGFTQGKWWGGGRSEIPAPKRCREGDKVTLALILNHGILYGGFWQSVCESRGLDRCNPGRRDRVPKAWSCPKFFSLQNSVCDGPALRRAEGRRGEKGGKVSKGEILEN